MHHFGKGVVCVWCFHCIMAIWCFFCVEFQLYIVPPFQTSSGFTWKDLDGNFSETLSWLVEYQARHKRRIFWFCSDSLLLSGMAFQVFVCDLFMDEWWKSLKMLLWCHNFMFVGFLQLPVESICHLHPLTVHIRYMFVLCFRVQNVTFAQQSAHKLDKSMN